MIITLPVAIVSLLMYGNISNEFVQQASDALDLLVDCHKKMPRKLERTLDTFYKLMSALESAYNDLMHSHRTFFMQYNDKRRFERFSITFEGVEKSTFQRESSHSEYFLQRHLHGDHVPGAHLLGVESVV